MTETTDNLSLFPEVDERATIKRVVSFFKVTLPKMTRYSGHSIVDLKSPIISDMPGAKKVENEADKRIVRRLMAENVVKQTIRALDHCDTISQQIISALYLNHDNRYDYEVISALGLSERSYYYRKNKALLMFADSYLLDDLHTFKDEK